MADARWKDKTLLAYAGMAATDTMPITDTDVDTDKYTTLAEVKKYALDNKTIGGSDVDAVTTNNATQTLTGKTLTNPKINEAVAVTAKATEINKLTGCTATTADLNLTHTYAAKIPYLVNVTDDIQGQINGLGISPEFLLHCYADTFVAAGSSKTYAESDIITRIGLSTALYYIDPATLNIQTCSISGGAYTVKEDTGDVVTTTAVTGGVTHVDAVKLAGLTPLSNYSIAMHFKLILKPGI